MSDNTTDEQAAASVSGAAANSNPDPPAESSAESSPEPSPDPPPSNNAAPSDSPAETSSAEAPTDPPTEPADEAPANPPAASPEQPPAEPVAEPVSEPASEPVAEPVAEPEAEDPPAPGAEPSEEPSAAAEPVAEPQSVEPMAAAFSAPSASPSAPPSQPEPDPEPEPEPEPSTSKSGSPEDPAPPGARALAVPERKPPPYSDPEPATALLDERKPDAFDAEASQAKLKYPKSVFFIISNEFCERFSFYGMRTILVIYLTTILSYEQDTATVIYHIFTMFCYFFPILGSMIADSWLGKFRTIFFLSIVYAIGNIVVSLASADGSIDIPGRELTIVGLLLIAFGTGGIKPCVSAFGGDQFILPQQEKQMAQFFSLFYFSINSGSLVSTFLTPVLREDVQCLNKDSCYPLAFGIPAILMIVSIIIFVAGRSLYIVKKPQGNVVMQVSKCMGHAVAQKVRSKGPKRDHWLDYADDKYDRRQIEDIKSALRVLFLYLPLPFFWALYDQQGSRWTFQATRMTGKLGSWSLKPDQVQVINPLLILLFIPMFETIIYPLLKKCNLLTRPLQRLGVGGILAGLAFVISAIVELQLEKSYAVVPGSGEGQIRIFNGQNHDIALQLNNDDITIKSYEMWVQQHWSLHDKEEVNWSSTDGSNGTITLRERQALSFLMTTDNLMQLSGEDGDEVEKEKEVARIRVIFNNEANSVHIGDTVFTNLRSGAYGESKLTDLTPKEYQVRIGNAQPSGDIELLVGGVYALMVPEMKLHEITPHNNMHMLVLIPQYVVLTAGEVMYSVTGLEFSYSQSPLSMKSVMQAGWLLTVAFGNLIVVIIAEAKFFDRQLWEFVLFAGLMFVDMLVFALMAMGYKYIETPHEGQDLPLQPTEEKKGIENANFKRDDEQ